MKAKPILFTGPMIRAILDGHKSQTRRIITPQPVHLDTKAPDGSWLWTNSQKKLDRLVALYGTDDFVPAVTDTRPHALWAGGKYRPAMPGMCRYGNKAGDLLWVRETWRIYSWDECPEYFQYKADNSIYQVNENALGYMDNQEWNDRIMLQTIDDCEKAGFELSEDGFYTFSDDDLPTRWRPSIHMPRWAGRLILRLTEDVRVERVQDISAIDAMWEGVPRAHLKYSRMTIEALGNRSATGLAAIDDFAQIWDSINAKRGFGWDMNPWVWVLTFEVVDELTT